MGKNEPSEIFTTAVAISMAHKAQYICPEKAERLNAEESALSRIRDQQLRADIREMTRPL